MNTWRRPTRRTIGWVLATLVFSLGFLAAAAPDLLDVSSVLRRIERSAPGQEGQAASSGAQLLKDIVAFRTNASSLAPAAAAHQWFTLYDAAVALGPVNVNGNFASIDRVTSNVVGVPSVISALPPPPAWPFLQQEAAARSKKQPHDASALGLRLLTELLTGNRSAAATTLADFEKLAADWAPGEREQLRSQVTAIRVQLAKMYGTPEEIAATFVASLRSSGPQYSMEEREVPDLVGLVGEARAQELLREAVTLKLRLYVENGDATRALARRVALEKIAALRVPQWGLVSGIDGADLYEALVKRFGITPKPTAAEGSDEAGADEISYDFRKQQADVYYFLSLVIAGRQVEAEKALAAIAGQSQISIPKQAVEALQRAHENEALNRFLGSQLERKPELQAWELYVEQAAFTGHSDEALALIDRVLARKDLPEFVRTDLGNRRLSALLAIDRVDEALKGYRELLAKPPNPAERMLAVRTEAAARLVGLGRELGKRDLSAIGQDFLTAALAFPGGEDSDDRATQLQLVFTELRRGGRAADAQALAIRELSRAPDHANPLSEQFGIMGKKPGERAAMIELASIFAADKRPADVLKLLHESDRWGARDLSEIVTDRDSLGVPFGLTVARSLQASGESVSAINIVRAVIDRERGYDPAYEFLVTLDSSAGTTLDALYLQDQFEERPLIWKAVTQLRARALDAAETTIKRAITVDPSDGEEGVNDRMRAYAVLADVLEAKGNASEAANYRQAVAAIRISEHADELHRLGLYQRAFAGYREALGHFADAYCIQSRLAVQLNRQGHRQEALEHYRRAYELMPDSFGRVESHCFGCESVFQGPESQGIAEQVFTDIIRKTPGKAQPYYLLGYLREEEGRYADAVQPLRNAVSIDPEYLNAWRHLHDLAEHTFIDAGERDIARIKLIELDPMRRHAQYELSEVGDLTLLWNSVEKAGKSAQAGVAPSMELYPLRRSADAYNAYAAKLPAELRTQVEQLRGLLRDMHSASQLPPATQVLARHKLVQLSVALTGAVPEQFE